MSSFVRDMLADNWERPYVCIPISYSNREYTVCSVHEQTGYIAVCAGSGDHKVVVIDATTDPIWVNDPKVAPGSVNARNDWPALPPPPSATPRTTASNESTVDQDSRTKATISGLRGPRGVGFLQCSDDFDSIASDSTAEHQAVSVQQIRNRIAISENAAHSLSIWEFEADFSSSKRIAACTVFDDGNLVLRYPQQLVTLADPRTGRPRILLAGGASNNVLCIDALSTCCVWNTGHIDWPWGIAYHAPSETVCVTNGYGLFQFKLYDDDARRDHGTEGDGSRLVLRRDSAYDGVVPVLEEDVVDIDQSGVLLYKSRSDPAAPDNTVSCEHLAFKNLESDDKSAATDDSAVRVVTSIGTENDPSQGTAIRGIRIDESHGRIILTISSRTSAQLVILQASATTKSARKR